MHALGFLGIRGVELAEHSSPAAIAGSVTDVEFLGGGGGGVQDELLGLWIEVRGGLQRLHVRTVTALGHGEATESLEVHQVGHHLVVALGTEVAHSTAEQTPLHAHLHHEGKVNVAEHLDGGQRLAGIAGSTLGFLEHTAGQAQLQHLLQLAGDCLAALLQWQADGRQHVDLVEQFADCSAGFGEFAVEDGLQVFGNGFCQELIDLSLQSCWGITTAGSGGSVLGYFGVFL